MKMNKKISLIILLLLLTIPVFFSQVIYGRGKPQEWFDSYGKTTWEKEKPRLENFAIALRSNPNYIGYLYFKVGKSETYEEVKNRVLRAKKYLISHFKISSNRLKIVSLGKSELTKIILQPLPKGKVYSHF